MLRRVKWLLSRGGNDILALDYTDVLLGRRFGGFLNVALLWDKTTLVERVAHLIISRA